jgi:hypothetical protein
LHCCGVGRKPESGSIKAAKSRPPSAGQKAPAGRKGTFDKAERVESAFALLSQKVTKAMRRIWSSLPDREKGKLIETDYQRYDRERLCQP